MERKHVYQIWQNIKNKSKTEKYSRSSITSSEYSYQQSFDSSVKTQSSVLSIKISNENDENVVIQLYPKKRKCRESKKDVVKSKNKKSILKRQAAGGNTPDNKSTPNKNDIQCFESCVKMYRETYGPTLDETILVGIETYKHGCKDYDNDHSSVIAEIGSDYNYRSPEISNMQNYNSISNMNNSYMDEEIRTPVYPSSPYNSKKISLPNNEYIEEEEEEEEEEEPFKNNFSASSYNINKKFVSKNEYIQEEPYTNNFSSSPRNSEKPIISKNNVQKYNAEMKPTKSYVKQESPNISSQAVYGTSNEHAFGRNYKDYNSITNTSLKNNNIEQHSPEIDSKNSIFSKNNSSTSNVENYKEDNLSKSQKSNNRCSIIVDKTSSSRCQNCQVSLTKQLASDKKYSCTKFSKFNVNAKFLDLDKRKCPNNEKLNFCKSMYTDKELNILRKYIDIPLLGKYSFLKNAENGQIISTVTSQNSQYGENSDYLKLYRLSFKNPPSEMKQTSSPSTSTGYSKKKNISILSILNDEPVLHDLKVIEENVYQREPIPEWQKKQTYPTAYFVQYATVQNQPPRSSSSESDTETNVQKSTPRNKAQMVTINDEPIKQKRVKTNTTSSSSSTSSSTESVTNQSVVITEGCSDTDCKCKHKCPSAVIFPSGQTYLPSIFKKVKKKSYKSSTQIFEIHHIIKTSSSSNEAENGSFKCNCSNVEHCNLPMCHSYEEQTTDSSYSKITQSTLYDRETPPNFCEIEISSSSDSMSVSEPPSRENDISKIEKISVDAEEDTDLTTTVLNEYVPGEQLVSSDGLPDEQNNYQNNHQGDNRRALQRLEEETDLEYKEAEKTVVPSYRTLEQSKTSNTCIQPCNCMENLTLENLGIQIAIISNNKKEDKCVASDNLDKITHSVVTQTETCSPENCKQDISTKTETDISLSKPKSKPSIFFKDEKICSECESKNSIKKKRSCITHSSNLSQPSKDVACEGAGLLKDRNIVPNETRYAITRVTRYDDFTTYEVMKSTKMKPKYIPCATEGVFIVKNKDKKNAFIPNS